MTTWTCALCGATHDELPMCYGAEAPWRAMGVTDADFADRVDVNADQCVVDGRHFFVRGHVEIAVEGRAEAFAWSVWVSLSEASFARMNERWRAPDRAEDPPYFGWLMTSLPPYPETLHLKTSVQSRAPGLVPLITVEPSDHPLSAEQRLGIRLARVEEIAHLVMGHGS